MRQVLAASLLMGSLTIPLMGMASGSGTSPATPAVRACSLLTREVVAQVTPYDKQVLDLVLRAAPIEDAIGASGSACSYGGITMQLDPFAPTTIEQQRGKGWAPVPGVGDAAYFVDNRGEYAELYARAGSRVLTIQMDVPAGRTAASVQPNVVALAKAILPRLK